MIRGGTELKECRSDRSIAHCGGAGGRGRDKARRGCTRSHALTPFPSHATHHLLQLKNASERESVQKYSQVQYSKVSPGPHRQWPVAWSYPSTLLFPPSSRQSYSRLAQRRHQAMPPLPCSFPSEASHKSRNVREHRCKSHHTSHIDQYSKTCEKVLLRLVAWLLDL
jgi:hypothetical protein